MEEVYDCGWDDCFSCPYEDCIVKEDNSKKNKLEIRFVFKKAQREHTIPEINLKEFWGWSIR